MTRSTGVGRGFRPLEPRFWQKVAIGTGCWEWQSIISSPSKGGPGGYGLISVGGRRKMAHRVSWEFAYGPIPEGSSVLHRCDNRRCVRPSHLFLGTYSDNARDMFAKGRGNQTLTPAEVRAIRRLRDEGARVKDIALAFGVHRSAITRVISGARWEWVA